MILKAAYKFDTTVNVRFSTYARWWIKSSIQEFVLKNWSIVRIGSTAIQKFLFFQLGRLKNKIQNSSLENNNIQPITHEIAKDMKIEVSEVEKISERIPSNGTYPAARLDRLQWPRHRGPRARQNWRGL